MDEFKLGDKVFLIEMVGYDAEWTVTYIDGNKVHCLIYDDTLGFQSVIIDKILLRAA